MSALIWITQVRLVSISTSKLQLPRKVFKLLLSISHSQTIKFQLFIKNLEASIWNPIKEIKKWIWKLFWSVLFSSLMPLDQNDPDFSSFMVTEPLKPALLPRMIQKKPSWEEYRNETGHWCLWLQIWNHKKDELPWWAPWQKQLKRVHKN